MATQPPKAASAFRTIGEVSDQLGVPRHILRYWETRFPQLRPLQRAGNRRYYRPADVALLIEIDRLLNHDGYTVRGVQAMLAARSPEAPAALPPGAPDDAQDVRTPASADLNAVFEQLTALRDQLKRAIDQDDMAARLG